MRALEYATYALPCFEDFKKMGVKLHKHSPLGKMRRELLTTNNTIRRLLNMIEKERPSNKINLIFYDLNNLHVINGRMSQK